MSNRLEISGAAVIDLKAYLLGHEQDIAYNINDFGDLSHVFHVIFGRQAQEDKPSAAPGSGGSE